MQSRKKKMIGIVLTVIMALTMSVSMTGCGSNGDTAGKTVITMLQYKQEAVDIFEQFQEEFNATHDDIYLKIESPSDATTVLKTRLIRGEEPDIIGFGGDVLYSEFVDAQILSDLTNYEGLSKVNPAYLDILESLEYVPTDGVYGLPYVANAAGVLYNKDMFEEHGWEIPTSWSEFLKLCDTIEKEGIQPLYFGFKDTWTCLAPWNAIAIQLAPSDVCYQVSNGQTTFTKEYAETADKIGQLLQYGEDGPFAYGYNDACLAFAAGESAMFTIGSYAIPQIKSSNPDMNIGSFVMPAADQESDLILNSGVDLQFAVTERCENKEAAYEVLDFLINEDNIQKYIDAQNAVPCINGEFNMAKELDDMVPYIEAGRMADFQDHHYPTEMAVDAMIQTYLIDGDAEEFLGKFDTNWARYNRDIIQKVKDYEAAHAGSN